LAIQWGSKVKPNRRVTDFIGFNDFAPTILEIAGISDSLPQMSGKSFLNILKSKKSGRIDPSRDFALSGKERHNYSRVDNLGYPIRALRTDQFLYLINFEPSRWPSGDPELYRDGELTTPSGQSMIQNMSADTVASKFFHLVVDKRADEELYDIISDPGCLNNLAQKKDFQSTLKNLRAKLKQELVAQHDPRILGEGYLFDGYPTFKPNQLYNEEGQQLFSGFAEYGKYNPKLIKHKN